MYKGVTGVCVGGGGSVTLALLEGDGSGGEDMAQPSLEYADLQIQGQLCLKEQGQTPSERCPLTSAHLCGAGVSTLPPPHSLPPRANHSQSQF